MWELDKLDKHSKILSGLELEMTQSAPPVEQMQPMVLAIVTMVEMVTTKQENVTVLSDSFMSQCSMTSFGMFFVGQSQTWHNTSANLVSC